MVEYQSLDQTSQRLAELAGEGRRYVVSLRTDPPSGDSPFLDRPWLTTREGFAHVRGLAGHEAYRDATLRWMFRTTELYVNSRLLSELTRHYRFTHFDGAGLEPDRLSLAQAFNRGLAPSPLGAAMRRAFLDRVEPLAECLFELWERRRELARRAGFDHLESVEFPTDDLDGAAAVTLQTTQVLADHFVPFDESEWWLAALATSTEAVWPAHLNTRTLFPLLGSPEWTQGLLLEPGPLPSALNPASFVRALWYLGAAWDRSNSARSGPFVLACDPYGLRPCILGSLFAALPTLPSWQRKVCGLGWDAAKSYARELLISRLIAVRMAALTAGLRCRLAQGRTALLSDYEDRSRQAIHQSWGAAAAGFLPRIHQDTGQRLLGWLLAESWLVDLTYRFDEDWFRNPRGIQALREKTNQIPSPRVDKAEVLRGATDLEQRFCAALT